MNVALFGGSFDPPHNGHLIIARWVLQHDPTIDEVWLLPTYAHHWKPMHASAEDRLHMTQLIAENNIKASDIDVRLKIRYNIETIRYLKEHTENTYLWVCGADTVKDFHRWKEHEELQRRISFLVVPREGTTIEKLPDSFSFLTGGFSPVAYSSTEIRRRVREGLPIDDMTPEKVRKYIKEKGLYK